MGTSTYTINLYQVKVQVTGSAPLTANGLDYSQYSIVLHSGTAGQNPITDYQAAFNQLFHWTTGDLQVSPTASSDGTYLVTLTAQGWQNVLTALQKVFNSYGNVDHAPNFVCNQETDIISTANATKQDDHQQPVQPSTPGQHPGQSGDVVNQPSAGATTNTTGSPVAEQPVPVATTTKHRDQLPQTGNHHDAAVLVLGTLSAMLGLGLATKRRHN